MSAAFHATIWSGVVVARSSEPMCSASFFSLPLQLFRVAIEMLDSVTYWSK
jgi:hypothetical protein